MENQEKYICENCGKEHDGSYGSGRFCSEHCRRAYCAKQRKVFKCNWAKNKPKEGGWQCKCGEIFRTRKELYEHKAIWHKIETKKNEYKNIKLSKDDIKKKISNSLKLAYKEGRHKGWAYTRQNQFGMSIPEKYFYTCFKKFKDNNFEYNFPIGKYKLDFAWPNKHIYIEIDGEQHYCSLENMHYDIERNNEIRKLGYFCILRIRWSDFLKLDFDCKKEYVNNIDKMILYTYQFYSKDNFYSSVDDIFYKNSQYFKDTLKFALIKNGQLRKDGIASKCIISNQEWERRKNLLLNAKTDMTKFGWVGKMEKETNMTKHMIEDVLDHFPEIFEGKFFRRRLCYTKTTKSTKKLKISL